MDDAALSCLGTSEEMKACSQVGSFCPFTRKKPRSLISRS